jgi:hypothetical protein
MIHETKEMYYIDLDAYCTRNQNTNQHVNQGMIPFEHSEDIELYLQSDNEN